MHKETVLVSDIGGKKQKIKKTQINQQQTKTK